MIDAAAALRMLADAVVVAVRLTPRAARDGIDGFEQLADGRCVLAVRVRAVPEKGAANSELEKTLAKALKVARSDVSVASGSTSRLKTVKISGDPADLARRLTALAPN